MTNPFDSPEAPPEKGQPSSFLQDAGRGGGHGAMIQGVFIGLALLMGLLEGQDGVAFGMLFSGFAVVLWLVPMLILAAVRRSPGYAIGAIGVAGAGFLFGTVMCFATASPINLH